jgi:hypothetical protein
MPNTKLKRISMTSDLDRVLHVVVQAAQRRVGYLMSWGFGSEHPEVQASRTMFEMQQHVVNVHLHAQRSKQGQETAQEA